MAIFENTNSNSLKGLETKEKAGISQPAVCIGEPDGIRTHDPLIKSLKLILLHYVIKCYRSV